MIANAQPQVRRASAFRTPSPVCLGLLCAALLSGGQMATAATLWLTGPTGAAVSINGQERGRFPLPGPLTLSPGQYELRCRQPGYASYRETIELRDDGDWLRWDIHLLPLSRTTAVASNFLLAGLGQHYLDRSREGYLFNGLEIGGLVTALIGEFAFQNHKDDYLLMFDEYQRALSESDIEFFRSAAEEAHRKMDDADSLRKTGLLVAAGAVVVSVLDAWLRFPSAFVGTGELSSSGVSGTASGHATGVRRHPATGRAALYAGWRVSF